MMVVATRKFARTVSYEPRNIIGRAKAHKYAAIHLPFRIKAKADFITADMDKGSFKIVEMKRGVGQVGASQTASYLQMPIIARGHYILPPEPIKTASPIEISCLNQELVETLLGSQGKYVLEQVLSVVQDLALRMDWPLARIEIHYVRDPEVEDWEYVLLLLVFTCDFDTADRHLHELYNQIDMLTDKLSDEEQEILRRMIFFDIETKASISSA